MQFDRIVSFVKEIFPTEDVVPLHRPFFDEAELNLVAGVIESTFVSSVGQEIQALEQSVAKLTGVNHAIAVVNGTAALQIALEASGVMPGDLVITQPLTFVATCNAIKFCGADPVFVDVDLSHYGLCPESLESWLFQHAELLDDGGCRCKETGRRISACLPMNTLGHPCNFRRLAAVTKKWGLRLVEDAAEALGSRYIGSPCGSLGDIGTLSFNGNKIVTTGGGGMVLLDDDSLAQKIRDLTTTAKVQHPWEFEHFAVAHNFRMPNINAALGLAQLGKLDFFIQKKRELANKYRSFFAEEFGMKTLLEPVNCSSNYWLNSVICNSKKERDLLLAHTNQSGVNTRGMWRLMYDLSMYADCRKAPCPNAQKLYDTAVCLPSSVPYAT